MALGEANPLRPHPPERITPLTWAAARSVLLLRAALTARQTSWAMGEILANQATPAQIAGFAVALRAKGETIDEVEGLVAAMYEHATPLTITEKNISIRPNTVPSRPSNGEIRAMVPSVLRKRSSRCTT